VFEIAAAVLATSRWPACHTRSMLRMRHLLAALLLLGLFAAAVPVGALADGGSAGDQQYVDPLAGNNNSHSSSSAPSSSSSAPSSSGSSSGSASSGTSSGDTSSSSASSSGASSSGASSSSSSAPTATTVTGTPVSGTTTTSGADPSSAGQLPRTGYDSRLAAAIGLVLLLAGIVLRRRSRPA
jgi:LPXTG-motif cell wall-anchored protein